MMQMKKRKITINRFIAVLCVAIMLMESVCNDGIVIYAAENNAPSVELIENNSSTDGDNEVTVTAMNGSVGVTLDEEISSGECGENLTWKLGKDKDQRVTLIISGTGEMENYTTSNRAPWRTSSVEIVYLDEGITSIGDYAFSGCKSLTDITTPKSLTSIGKFAFSGCNSLTSFLLSEGITFVGQQAFDGCSSLTSITIPKSLTSGECAFSSCGGLTSISFAEGVTSIGKGMFIHCTGLTSITIPEGVISIGQSAFSDCSGLTSITMPESLVDIEAYAFFNCSSMSNLTIPQGVTSIGKFAFAGWSSMTEYTIPDDTKKIEDGSFAGWSSLKNITIPQGVTSIGAYAFNGCSSLKSITIPEGVTSIGEYAFCDCSGLTSIMFPDKVTSIENSVLRGCSGLTNFTVPERVTKIGNLAFFHCSNLNNITIPESVESIGYSAFCGCSSLKSIAIPEGVSSIGTQTFQSCSSLANITIPKSVKSIGKYAFHLCNNLKSIYYNGVSASWNEISIDATDAANDKLQSATVYIRGIDIDTDAAEIYDNETVQLTATVESYKSNDDLTVSWTSSDNAVAEVTQEGLVSGVSQGTATITATSLGGDEKAVCVVTVKPILVQGVTLSDAEAKMEVGDSRQLTANITPVDASDKRVQWTSDNESVAIVDETGAVTAKAAGVAAITATTVDGAYTAKCEVSVTASGNCGENLTWKLAPDAEHKLVLTITGTGNMENYGYSDSAPWKNSYVEIVSVGEGVTSIGDYAFNDHSGLTEIILPDGVTSIGNHSFDACTGLKSITIPESVTSIGSDAFFHCRSLLNVTIPVGVTSIGDNTFYHCDGLMSVTLPQGVTSIGEYAFSGCDSLESITIPESVQSIGRGAFKNCGGLRSITLPKSMTSITRELFYGCGNIESITIPHEVMDIADYAFFGCANLRSVYYDGKEETWDKIDIGNHNDILQNISLHVRGIVLDKKTVEIYKNATVQLTATVETYIDSDDLTISWNSNDETVATVTQDGLVTGISEGVATIAATSLGGETEEICVVTVVQEPCSHENTEVRDRKEATCTETGYTGDIYCSECGENIQEGSVIDTITHTLQIHQKLDATETTLGNIEYWECMVCHKYFSDAEGMTEINPEDTLIPMITVVGLSIAFDDSKIMKNEEGDYALTYTGCALKPAVIVKNNGKLLTEGTDYTLKYANNINVSAKDASVTVIGKGIYAGKRELFFKVAQKDISVLADTDREIGVGNTLVESGKSANPVVTYKGNVLRKGKDYTVSDVKNGKITITGIGNFIGSREESVTESGKSELKKAAIKVTLTKVNKIYDAMPQTLSESELIVKNANGDTLKKYDPETQVGDYIVTYSPNVDAGTVKVTVTGRGIYSGTVKKSFKINPARDAKFKVSMDRESYTYAKTGVKPVLTVTATLQGGNMLPLVEGRDFKVSYSGNKKVGTGKWKLTFLGNYKGAKYTESDNTFIIKAAQLTDATIDTEQGNTYVIVGDMIYKKTAKYQPKPFVIVNGSLLAKSDYMTEYKEKGTLTLGTSETKTYALNVKAKAAKNAKYEDGTNGVGIIAPYNVIAGTACVDVTKAKLTLQKDNKVVKSVNYTGKEITFSSSKNSAGGKVTDTTGIALTLKIDKNTTLTTAQIEQYFDIYYADNVEKGKATIIISAKSDSPYIGACAGTFTISSKLIDK